MELKDVLGEIESDGAHLVHGRLLEWALTPPLCHAEAVQTIKPPLRATVPLEGCHRTRLVSTGVASTDALVYQRCRGPVREVREPDPIRFDEASPVAPAL